VGFCAAVIAATGVAVAACGTVSPSGSATNPTTPTAKTPIQAIDAAYTSTTTAGTAKLSMDMAMSGQAMQGHKVDFTGNGVVDFAHRSGDLSMSILGMDMEIRYLNDVEYIHAPSELSSLDGGKPWMKLDLNELAKANLGASMDQLTSSTPTDPSQLLSYLQGVSSNVTDDGPATIDGTATTHYTAQMNVADVIKKENLPADKATQMRKLFGSPTVPLQVWVDSQNRLRQMSFDQKIDAGAITGATSGAGGGTVDMAMTMKLSDFGVPVNVAVPPADQTGDAASMLGGK
jgi:hypothetical protein